MKISSIEFIPVKLMYAKPVSDAWGEYKWEKAGIVRVADEEGTVGYGEVSLAWFGGVHHMLKEAEEVWTPRLLGRETSDICGLNAVLDELAVFSKRHLLLKAGIEMAVWDLLGKERNLPVYELLGGKRRDRIQLTGGVSMLPLPEMVAQAVALVADGFKELKIKVGIEDKKDLETVAAIRKAVGDEIRIRVDANMAWKDRKAAQKMMEALYDYGVELVEQPLDCRDHDGIRWLRNNTPSTILIDEGVWDVADLVDCIKEDSVDIPHVYICEAGGIDGARQIFEVSKAFGMSCTIGSMPESLTGACAAAQVAAAMPNLSEHPSDLRGFTVFGEDFAETSMHIENGELVLPDGPGLGFNMNLELLEKLRADK